jgi:hypothetical protein
VRKPFATRARASSSSRSAHVDLSAHQAQGPGPIAGAPLALVGTGSKPELAASLRRAVRVRRLAGDERVGRSRRRSRGRRSLRLLPLSPLRSLALRGSFRPSPARPRLSACLRGLFDFDPAPAAALGRRPANDERLDGRRFSFATAKFRARTPRSRATDPGFPRASAPPQHLAESRGCSIRPRPQARRSPVRDE